MPKLSLLLLAVAAPLAAQAPAVRLIAAPDAQTKPQFGVVTAVRQLPGGKLLVNDVAKRQLSLLDQSLANVTVVADSAAGTASSYGTRGGGLIPFLADSSLFVDPAGLSMFVIDPAGKITRVASVPRSQDAQTIGSNTLNNPALDAKGRLIYRAGTQFSFGPGGRGGAPVNGRGGPPTPAAAAAAALPGGAGLGLPELPDSSPILRIDLSTRKLDTAAHYKVYRPKMVQQPNPNGNGFMMISETNPLPLLDDWAVLADGSIAIVRGQDYHVDFVNADGSISAGTKVPYEWQRLGDEDKLAVIDSAKKAADAFRAAIAAGANPATLSGGDGGGAPRMVMNFSTGGNDGGGGGAQRMMAGGNAPTIGMGQATYIAANELPDYRPVFSLGAARGDADGNLWVRTTATRAGSAGQIYDIINRRGELIDRLQIPPGRNIVGFGKGGIVYMLARDASGGWIERTHR